MNLIAHRCNTIDSLKAVPSRYGVEVDVRSEREQLITHHDPFQRGTLFQDWIAEYRHGTLILNVKEEGLEQELISLMKSSGIEDYFFLDQSFPFLVKWAMLGERRCAARVSEYESIDTAMTLAGRIDWIWVDCFSRFPLDRKGASRLKNAGFRLCLVSPELQGRNADTEIPLMARTLDDLAIGADAVCTKRPDLWEQAGAFK